MSNLLNWPHWVIDLVEENDHDYRISAHLLSMPTACPLCGTIGVLRPYGVREQRFMDLPIHANVDNWQEPIFNYFDTGMTNAYTEALNGVIKVANRNGRGYSFDAIRAKVLYSEGSHMKRKPIYRDGWKKTGLPQVVELPVSPEPLGYLYENVEYDPNREENVNFGVALSTFAKLLEDYPNEPDSTTKSE